MLMDALKNPNRGGFGVVARHVTKGQKKKKVVLLVKRGLDIERTAEKFGFAP